MNRSGLLIARAASQREDMRDDANMFVAAKLPVPLLLLVATAVKC